MTIRTRIAPSPTGYMHIGTARTALFNYLFAKKLNGDFLLRIEDTDTERSVKAYENNIIDGLKWLGLNWDGEIVRQSSRTEIYKKHLIHLLDEGKAYYCPHTKEQLEKEKVEGNKDNLTIIHKCNARDKNLDTGELIRFKNNATQIQTFDDKIRGQVGVLPMPLGDFSLAKNLNEPLYNFAVVVDDYEMRITNVIRGEDHLSNTTKQVMIQEAMGFPRPEYAHLPLILATDRSKLSKRHGGTSVTEYREQGYLPQALINFMALLGWHPNTNQEIFSLEELIKEFDITRVQKGGAVFDINKLNSINHHYIKNTVPAELVKLLKPHLEKYNPDDNQLVKIAHLLRDRLSKSSEIRELAGFIFELPDYPPELLVWKHSAPAATKENLELMLAKTEKIESGSFDIDTLTTEIMPVANEKGRGEFLWPLRVALSGLDKSPGPFEIMEVLGKEESTKRLKSAVAKLS